MRGKEKAIFLIKNKPGPERASQTFHLTGLTVPLEVPQHLLTE